MAGWYGKVGAGEGVEAVNPSTVIADTIIDELIRGGVAEFVIAPGSRNAPLSIAVARASHLGRVRMHTRVDERSAAFLALGLAKGSGRASAVITTSGTAAANLHPAVLEASHSDIPLLVITADRPIELRDTGANQTTHQVDLFGKAVRHFAEIGEIDDEEFLRSATSRAVSSTTTGPVHINVPLREPLVGDGRAGKGRNDDLPWTTVVHELPHSFDISLDLPAHGVVVVAHDHSNVTSAEIEQFAEEMGWPIVAEDPLSLPAAVAHASLFLANEKVRKQLKPRLVIVIGRPVLSRSISALISESDRVIVVDDSYQWSDPQRQAELVLPSLPLAEGERDSQWLLQWRDHQEKASTAVASLPEWSEPSLLAHFAANLPAECTLFVGASRPIRDLEGFASPRAGVAAFANRGLAGIDGAISTAIGVALASDLPNFAVMGDLTFLHDINGLLIPESDERPALTILVIDNNGGGIFSTLAQKDVPDFDRIFGTPHDRSIQAIAAAYGVEVAEVKSLQEVSDAMKASAGKDVGIKVLVASMPSRSENAKLLSTLSF